MPLLEIIQTRHISASIRLDEATATQVDQYAAFHSCIRRTTWWIRLSTTSSRRTVTFRSS